MPTLQNNEFETVRRGRYALKVTGAMEFQWRIRGEEFTTLEAGTFSGATDVQISLPDCDVKIINAGTNVLYIAPLD